jgi:hypothetical protein
MSVLFHLKIFHSYKPSGLKIHMNRGAYYTVLWPACRSATPPLTIHPSINNSIHNSRFRGKNLYSIFDPQNKDETELLEIWSEQTYQCVCTDMLTLNPESKIFPPKGTIFFLFCSAYFMNFTQ